MRRVCHHGCQTTTYAAIKEVIIGTVHSFFWGGDMEGSDIVSAAMSERVRRDT